MLLRPERRRIRKEDISSPSNFVHIAHIGWGSQQQDGNHAQPDTSRASAQQIPFNQRPSSVQIIDQQNTGPRNVLLPSRPPPPRPAAVRVRPAVPPPPSAERRMRSAPSKPKTLVESTPEAVAATIAATSTSTSDATVPTSEAAASTAIATETSSGDTTPPSTLNSENNVINEETLSIAAAAIIVSATAEAAEEISPMETANEADTPVKTINEDDETTTKLAAAPIRLTSPIDFPPEDTAETTEMISTYTSHTADLETICLLLQADLKCSKMARDALEELVTCAICMTDRKSMALQPCGHSFCAKCPMRFEGPPVAPARTCPLCNQVFVNIVSFRL